MFELICVTNRRLCTDDFLSRLQTLAHAGIDRIVLREKDLSPEEYTVLLRQALPICGSRLIAHHFPSACQDTGLPRLHLSLHQLEAQPALRQQVQLLGVSVHAPEEARRAQELGADYVTAGHVFDTDCKRGLPGRDLDFLRDTCAAVSIPVYAIGGITAGRLAAVQQVGAAGACIMSGLMTCPDPAAVCRQMRRSLE